MKTSTKFKAGCGILAVFIGGFVLGVISLLVIVGGIMPLSEGWKTDESKAFIANHLAKQLELTPEQDEKFRPLVYEVLDRRWKMRSDYLSESHELMEEYLERADEILTEEQRQKGLEMLAKWRRDKRLRLEEEAPETAIVEGEEANGKPDEAEPPPEERVKEEAPPE